MKALINKTYIEGYLYEHNLELKVSGPNSKTPGTPFIAGTVSIATDEERTNVVPIHFSYVTSTTSKGTANATFTILKNIIDGVLQSHMGHGADKAVKLRVDSALGLNEFYTDRNGTEELVSAKRNEGGFVHTTDTLKEDNGVVRNYFECDMVITNCRRIEADDEKGLPEKMILKGGVFDFRKALLPVEFTVVHPKAMDYFESQGISQNAPMFTKVWGKQISETVVKKTVQESAFGDPVVNETKSTRRDWVITGANPEAYTWDDESTMTKEEFTKVIADREVFLADLKRRNDEYKASKGAAPEKANNANTGFNF